MALMGYKRQDYRLVDPDDPEHIDAYLELRRTTRRVQPDAFIAYLKKRVKALRNGEQTEIEFWAVPKSNFPKGLPPKILDACVADESEILEGQSLSVDRDKYYVIDKVIERNLLGKSVWTVKSYVDVGASCNLTGPAPALPGPDMGPRNDDSFVESDDDLPLGRHATGGGGSRGGPAATGLDLAITTAGHRRLRQRHDSEAGPRQRDGEGDELPLAMLPLENPEVKKAKTQLCTLKVLRANIIKAAEANVWIHKSNCLNPNSVLFWVDQTLLALHELGQDQQNKGRVGAIALSFRTFMINFVHSADCYPDWCKFKGMLPRLASMIGDDEIDECKLLENLASTDPEGFEFPKVRKTKIN